MSNVVLLLVNILKFGRGKRYSDTWNQLFWLVTVKREVEKNRILNERERMKGDFGWLWRSRGLSILPNVWRVEGTFTSSVSSSPEA